MKILFAASECAPFSKSGGLADVAFSLPPALKAAGDEIAVITPLHRCVRARFGNSLTKVLKTAVRLGNREERCGLYRGELSGVTVWFVENEAFFDRERLYGYDDDKLRFAWFCRAVIELLHSLDFVPDILHCNDWETALAVIYLKNDQVWRADLQGIKSVYTIHNIAYQGQFGANELTDTFALPESWYDGGLGYEYEGRRDVNLMKGAMLMADAVSTVSPTYALELHHPEFGCGLHGVADAVEHKLYGILNGIDMALYDPRRDKRIPCAFGPDGMEGKARCKAHIQKKFGLMPEAGWPVLASVARLVEQKGIELIREILPQLMDLGVQIIVFGQGEQHYIDYFNECTRRWPGQFGFSSDYSDGVASEVFAGADFYLMPSRFEPCGLSQMMAMRYGAIPIVHETGGLKDSVRPYSEFDGVGDGFSFSGYQGKALYLAIFSALKVYFGDKKTFALLRRRCMEKDFSWTRSAGQYDRMYMEIAGGGTGEAIPFEEAFKQLKAAYEEVDRDNHARHPGIWTPGWRRVIQFQLTGRTSGVFYVEFADEKLSVVASDYRDADAFVTASFDHLLGMATGKVTFDKLFISGQLKVSGNLAKGAEIRHLLGKLN